MLAVKLSIVGARTDAQSSPFFETGISVLMQGTEATPTEIANMAIFIGSSNESTFASLFADDYDRTNSATVAVDESNTSDLSMVRPMYFLLRWDAAGEDLYFYYSWDGRSWNAMGSKDYTGLDPISVGRFATHRNVLPAPTTHYYWFRVITDATMITNLEVGR
jgi:hypothetical protein